MIVKAFLSYLVFSAVLMLTGCVNSAPQDLKDASFERLMEIAVAGRGHADAKTRLAARDEILRRHPGPFNDSITMGKLAVGMSITEAQLVVGMLDGATSFTDARGTVYSYRVMFHQDNQPAVLYFVNEKLNAWEG